MPTKIKKRPRRPRVALTDGKQKAIRFPTALYNDLIELADRDDRDFAPYVRRVMQEHVDEKKAGKRAVFG